jgi:hypothetical protein
MAALARGTRARATASTLMNEGSSRSHSIFVMTLRQQTVDRATGVAKRLKASKVGGWVGRWVGR